MAFEIHHHTVTLQNKTNKIGQTGIIRGNHFATHLLIPGPGIPVFHEYITEGAVEDCIEEVCNAEVEDEDVGDCSHPVVPCTHKSHVGHLRL